VVSFTILTPESAINCYIQNRQHHTQGGPKSKLLSNIVIKSY